MNIVFKRIIRVVAAVFFLSPVFVYAIDRFMFARFVAVSGAAPDFSNYASVTLIDGFALCRTDAAFRFVASLLPNERIFVSAYIMATAALLVYFAGACRLGDRVGAGAFLFLLALYIWAGASVDTFCPAVIYYLIQG